MADPRIVENPKQIRAISYKELRELSYMGASVLHEDAIYPARMANVPINIRNTNQPEDPGTFITPRFLRTIAANRTTLSRELRAAAFIGCGAYQEHDEQRAGDREKNLDILDDYDINF